MHGLEYANLKKLKTFNLSHNEIVKIEHLDNLKSLRDLDLSSNRIKQFDAYSANIETHSILRSLSSLSS
jgi:Leucine-rich repeat (LRR) protein